MEKFNIRKNYNLSHLTWLKVGGKADVFFKPKDKFDLSKFLKLNKKPVTVIGAGSNIIIRDKGIEGVVIKLGQKFTQITRDNNKLKVGAACLNYNLAKFCVSEELASLEFLIGIPGTIGGGVAMNAGAYGSEFKDIVDNVEAVDMNGEFHRFTNDEIGFLYRSNSLPKNLIFTECEIQASLGKKDQIIDIMNQINKKRNATQPIKEMTGGSTFRNHDSINAWKLIDKSGLRGYTIGGASMSKIHCNFMINDGTATATDLEQLGDFIKKKVKEQSNIDLKWEIKRIGRLS